MQMIRKHRIFMLSAAALIVLGIAEGCTKSKPQGEEPEPVQQPAAAQEQKEEPVKLIMAQKWSEINEADFNLYIVEPLKSKYPHITIELMKGENIPEMIAGGIIPDVIATWVNLISDYQELDLTEDMTPLIQKHGLNLDRFEPNFLETIRGYDRKGLVALPYDSNFNLIYYNKDIFDQFGAPYPQDGMTWDETVELAKRVSRVDQGTRYRGLETDGYGKLALQLALPSVKDGKSNILREHELWKKVLELQKTINSIPNNEPIPDVHQRNQFIKDRNLAMFATGYNFNLLAQDSAKGLNWDIAQYPSWPDRPNVAGMVDIHVAFVTKPSKHKDAAFKVLEILTSDEIQRRMTRSSGKLSALKDSSIKRELGADMPALKGKHLEAIFKGTYIPAYTATSRYPNASKLLGDQVTKYLNGEQDLNEALRSADEAIQKHIDEVEASRGAK